MMCILKQHIYVRQKNLYIIRISQVAHACIYIAMLLHQFCHFQASLQKCVVTLDNCKYSCALELHSGNTLSVCTY